MYANDLMLLTHISFSFLARPQGKSYLFFTQFKAELKGTKIEYANVYVSITETQLPQLLDTMVAFPVHMDLFLCCRLILVHNKEYLIWVTDGFSFNFC